MFTLQYGKKWRIPKCNLSCFGAAESLYLGLRPNPAAAGSSGGLASCCPSHRAGIVRSLLYFIRGVDERTALNKRMICYLEPFTRFTDRMALDILAVDKSATVILATRHFGTATFWHSDILPPRHFGTLQKTDILPPRHFAT